MKMRVTMFVLAVVLLGHLAGGARAADFPSSPVYNPASKSYFQLFSDNTHPGTWVAARERAHSKFFKGVRGRLAQVRSAETHEFLIRTFHLNNPRLDVWIGLRYWCRLRMLQWEDERPFSPSDPEQFRIWHDPWERDANEPGGSCGMTGSRQQGFAPVYYRTLSGITLWQAVGAAKFFDYYLVEFPTGGE